MVIGSLLISILLSCGNISGIPVAEFFPNRDICHLNRFKVNSNDEQIDSVISRRQDDGNVQLNIFTKLKIDSIEQGFQKTFIYSKGGNRIYNDKNELLLNAFIKEGNSVKTRSEFFGKNIRNNTSFLKGEVSKLYEKQFMDMNRLFAEISLKTKKMVIHIELATGLGIVKIKMDSLDGATLWDIKLVDVEKCDF